MSSALILVHMQSCTFVFRNVTDSDMEEGIPVIEEDEDFPDYFSRTKYFWLEEAEKLAKSEGLDVTGRQVKKAASRMAEEHFNSKKS